VSVLPDTGVISFARGIPSPDMFPVELLAECARRAIEEDGRVALNYGPPSGYAPLRDWVARRHGVEPRRVLVTPGSLIGLGFVVRHLFSAGGCALVEAPTYDRMLHSLRDLGADIQSVPRTDVGLDLERLEASLSGDSRPKCFYVLPTFHNPTGRTLARAAREELVELAIEHELLLFEDDPYGLVRIEGDPEPTLHELFRARGADELCIFASSFSKTVAPGLRVGYLVLPEALASPIEALATRTYVSPPILPQAQLYAFLEAGHLEPHLSMLGAFLGERRDALLAVLEERLDGIATWTRPLGGYFLWLELPERFDAAELNERARRNGVAFVPGAGFFADGAGRGTARLSFSYPSAAEIRVGAERLADLVRPSA
jgi:2-aminoadipate transaminase